MNQQTPRDGVIRTSGRAEKELVPTVVYITVQIAIVKRTAYEADQELARQIKPVLDLLNNTTKVWRDTPSMRAITVYEQGQPPKITGYEASRTVRVSTERIYDVGKLLASVVRLGGTTENDVPRANISVTINDVSFEVHEEESRAARISVLAEATRNALDKARAMALVLAQDDEESLQELDIVEVNESGSTRSYPVYERSFMAADTPAMASRVESAPVSPGVLKIEASVDLITRMREQ